jgi:peptide/nickel transport system substrate-binding protein
MKVPKRWAALAGAVMGVLAAGDASAQKSGGVLHVQHMDTPPSASILEEATVSVVVPFMSLFNNLVLFDQNVPRNSFATIRPDLATEWQWSEDGRQLVFRLRDGVRWHDGNRSPPRTCAAPSTCC